MLSRKNVLLQDDRITNLGEWSLILTQSTVEFEFCSDLNTTLFLKRVIQDENPDFII